MISSSQTMYRPERLKPFNFVSATRCIIELIMTMQHHAEHKNLSQFHQILSREWQWDLPERHLLSRTSIPRDKEQVQHRKLTVALNLTYFLDLLLRDN